MFLRKLQSFNLANTFARRSIVYKTFDDIKNENMITKMPSGGCMSSQYLTRKDNMGFSIHYMIISPRKSMYFHYKHHLKAVFITQGRGELELVRQRGGSGDLYILKPNTMYALDKNDPHYLRSWANELHCVCVFNPPCIGNEIQDEEGSFPIQDTFLL
jgi:L-ectoine synthase